MSFLPIAILLMFADIEQVQQAQQVPGWLYPVLSACGLSVLANIGVLIRWWLAKPEADAKTRNVDAHTLSQVQDDLERLVGRYSHLAGKITDVEWDSDRRYRKLRNATLDRDEVDERVLMRLDTVADASLMDKIRSCQIKHRAAFEEEVAIEKKRQDAALHMSHSPATKE
jgi:hypothetical protein